MFFFFFFFNTEKRIGFKKLSLSDLGLGTSHQTHIGLYGNVFSFLHDEDVVKQAMLIYEDYCDILTCSFDRIMNPDGTYRSAKIRIGENKNDSIVGKIRQFVQQKPEEDWYLVWCGLESEELVFWLICGDSVDYKIASSFFPPKTRILDDSMPTFNDAMNFLLKKVNLVSFDVQKELERASQLGTKNYYFKPKDLLKAQKRFEEIGRRGEELINVYLDKQKSAGIINQFEWVNRSHESGLPYDFLIDKHQYVDVKSTNFDFNQSLYFSSNEIDFVSRINNSNYSVYRVFDMKEDTSRFKICNNCAQYMRSMQKAITDFEEIVRGHKSSLQTLKLGVEPKSCFNSIQSDIIL